MWCFSSYQDRWPQISTLLLINRRPTQTNADIFFLARVACGNTQISRQTEKVDHTRMNRWIAQKFNGELLRDKTKLACSCHQVLPISPDISGPHAARGLLCDPPLKRADQTRVIRAFGEAKPVPRNTNFCDLCDLRGKQKKKI
jgi:hypothetical protein